MQTEVIGQDSGFLHAQTYSKALEAANDLLLFREFEKCLELCLTTLKEVCNYPERPRAVRLQEGLCIDAIQAYAELNRWQEVLPFVTKLYNGIEDSPPSIVKLCILLHADVKDYPTCSAIANIWLRNPNNFTKHGYVDLVDVYATHILLDLNRWDAIQPFLESCPGLSSEQQDRFLKVVRALRHQLDQAQAEQIQEITDEKVENEMVDDVEGLIEDDTLQLEGSEEVSSDDKSDITAQISTIKETNRVEMPQSTGLSQRFLTYCKWIGQWVKTNVPLAGLYIIRNISLITVILYLLLTRANIDMLSWSTYHRLWLAIAQLWKAMFAPFHVAKR